MVLLVNDKRLMGDHRNGRIANVLAWGAVGLVIALDAVLLAVAALGRSASASAEGRGPVASPRRRRRRERPIARLDREAPEPALPGRDAATDPGDASSKPAARSSDAATLAR